MISFFSSTRLTTWLLVAFLLFFVADWCWPAFPRWLYLLPAAFFYANLLGCLITRLIPLKKNLVGKVGLVAFHLGLGVAMAGGLVTALYRFEGGFEVGEGQIFSDQAESYLYRTYGPLWRPFFTDEAFFLKEILVASDAAGNITAFDCLVARAPGAEVFHRLAANRPLSLSKGQIFLSKHFGTALGFKAVRDDGAMNSGMVNFAPQQQKQTFTAPGLPYTLQVELGDKARQEILLAGFPGHFTRKQALTPGQGVRIGDTTLIYGKKAHWAGLMVVRDPGKPWVYAGFLLFSLGLLLYYSAKFTRQ